MGIKVAMAIALDIIHLCGPATFECFRILAGVDLVGKFKSKDLRQHAERACKIRRLHMCIDYARALSYSESWVYCASVSSLHRHLGIRS